MRTLRFSICDVFTDTPLTGNQLAVFTDARGVPPETMQALAAELGFSESVFVLRPEQRGHARLRIFTPTREVPFAGHPVLGTAFVLATALQSDELRLETGRGVIRVRLEREGAAVRFGWMTQPVPTVSLLPDPQPLLDALGVAGSTLAIELYDNGIPHAYVALPSSDDVARVRPDFERLAAVAPHGVSTFAGSGTDYKTRMFAPSHGVNEDAATGSAAGPLALHLARHGRLAFGDAIRIEQGAELGRPSVLHARVIGSAEAVERVEVGGSAVVVARGEFRVP